jgi:GDPmannose 4,6-dehydratase
MRSALVTGITGQDGGFLAERLVADGYLVHGLVHHDDATTGDLLARVPSVTLHTGDLADTHSVEKLVRASEPDEVYNLGGISSVALSWEESELTAEVSGVGALRIMESTRRWADSSGRTVRLVQASSGEIFGSPRQSPQDERTPICPTSPYGAAKAFAHFLVGAFRDRGLHASSAILYNHESPRRPLSFVTRKITRGVAEIVQGQRDRLVLGNLDAVRDWGYAPDYVDALVRIARQVEPDDYVVATGQAHTVADFVEAAFRHVGLEDWRSYVQIDEALLRPTDPAVLVGDSSKARQRLGWRPTVDFVDLVAKMVDSDLQDLRHPA